jgi:hypothetical protein
VARRTLPLPRLWRRPHLPRLSQGQRLLPECGEALYHQRADDAPPYVVIFIVGHIIIGLLLGVEKAYQPELWVHMVLWLPLTAIMSLALLPPVKGALVGLQWAIKMHGFDPASPEALEPPREGVAAQ